MVDQERQAPPDDGSDVPEDESLALDTELEDGATPDPAPVSDEPATAAAADVASAEEAASPDPTDAEGEGEEGTEATDALDSAGEAGEADGARVDSSEPPIDEPAGTAVETQALGSEPEPEPAAGAPTEPPDDVDEAPRPTDGATTAPEAEPEAPADLEPADPEPGSEVHPEPSPEPAPVLAAQPEAPVAAAAASPRPTVVSPPRPAPFTPEEPAWLPPEFEHQATEVASPPLGRSPGRLPAVILALLMAGVFLLFVLIEPTPMWLLLFGALISALGTDGVLRTIRHRHFEREDGPDTVPHIFLPTLFALAIPLFIEENLESYWVIPAALVAGVAFVLVVLAEVPAEVVEEDEFRGRARFVSVAATYFVAFALFSLAYRFDLGLHDAIIVIALVSVLLAVELLREDEIDPLETLLLAAVVGVVVAEARWVLKYMPIDAYPAGLTLVLVFYFVTGMVHAYMTRHINVTVAAEYTLVTVLGLGLVIAARATGIA